MRLLYMIWAVIAGVIIAVQATTNTALRVQLNSPLAATLMNFIVGFCSIMVIILVVKPHTFVEMKPILSGEVPLWKIMGGMIGACFVLSITILTPHLGVSKVIILYLVGQIIMSLIIDHFGLLGMVHPISNT